MKKLLVKLLIGTLLSMLVFFTVSFFSVIYSIKHDFVAYNFHLGFPFEYYYGFWLKDGFQFGGNFKNLLLDCLICWVIVAGIYLFARRKRSL